MSSSIIKVTCLIFFFLPVFLLGQKDQFNQFKTTKAAGEPPKLFKKTFEERVEYRKVKATEINENHKSDYVERTNFTLSNILKSGYVLYGDPMTNFVQKVGEKLLSNN